MAYRVGRLNCSGGLPMLNSRNAQGVPSRRKPSKETPRSAAGMVGFRTPAGCLSSANAFSLVRIAQPAQLARTCF